jgi:hypothetical protein
MLMNIFLGPRQLTSLTSSLSKVNRRPSRSSARSSPGRQLQSLGCSATLRIRAAAEQHQCQSWRTRRGARLLCRISRGRRAGGRATCAPCRRSEVTAPGGAAASAGGASPRRQGRRPDPGPGPAADLHEQSCDCAVAEIHIDMADDDSSDGDYEKDPEGSDECDSTDSDDVEAFEEGLDPNHSQVAAGAGFQRSVRPRPK